MKIAIHQPNYLPYPGFFGKVNLSDIFVIYDTAQFTRGNFINRNRIRTFSLNGYMWLTLPVGKKDFKEVSINQVKITDDKIFQKHGKTLKAMYSKAPYFNEEICECIETPHLNLAEHNVFIIKFLINKLNINHPRIILSSDLGITASHQTRGIIDIVKALNGDEYISGTGAKEYIKEDLFRKQSIALSFLDYKPIKYHQIHPGFVENMSILDTIFNLGWEGTALKLKEVKAVYT